MTSKGPRPEGRNFGDEVDELMEDLMLGKLGNFRYQASPDLTTGKWTIRDREADGAIIGDPLDTKGEAIEEALRLNE